MQIKKTTVVVSGILCAGWLLLSGAAAAPIGAATAAGSGTIEAPAGVPVLKVQHRHHGHHGGHYGGTGIAAGIAAGALLGAMAAQPAQPAVNPDAIAWCARRYRSYDPQSMTYLGRDGYRHPCP